MAYTEYAITAELKPFVKSIWSMENEPGEVPTFSMRILPDSCVEMVIHYKTPLITTFSNGLHNDQPKSFVVAQMKSFIELMPHGPYGFISIRFSAQGAYHFFGIPLKEIVNGVVSLEHVWKDVAKEIENNIAEARSGAERSSFVQNYLALQLRRNGEYDQAVDFSLTELYLSKGQISIEELAFRTGLSNRQLIRKFDQKVGMSPKEFSRIVRFMNAAHLLRDGKNSIYDNSYLCGYYDHAHFFHDFKKFSGLTPGQFQDRTDVFV